MRPRPAIALVMLAAALGGCGGGGDGTDEDAPAAGERVIATVEGVDGGEVSSEDLQSAVSAAAVKDGRAPPAPGTPEYDLLAGDALDELLLARWVRGEAAEQGISVSDEEVATRIDETVAGHEEEYASQLVEGGYCTGEEISAHTDPLDCARVLDSFRSDLLAERLGDPTPAELEGTWGPRTECDEDLVSRLCGSEEQPAPPDIPPASGLER